LHTGQLKATVEQFRFGESIMLDWDSASNTDDQEEDFLAKANDDGEAPVAAACPLNPDDFGACEACQ
jgi:hypothetical protein